MTVYLNESGLSKLHMQSNITLIRLVKYNTAMNISGMLAVMANFSDGSLIRTRKLAGFYQICLFTLHVNA